MDNITNFLTASLQMKSMSIFEAGMIICFGASWPFALWKTIKLKDVHGKSKRFMSLVLIGYIFGMTHKIVYNMDIIFWLYVITFTLVLTDLILTVVYGKEADEIKK